MVVLPVLFLGLRKDPDEPPIFPGGWPVLGHAHFFFGNTLNFWKVIKTLSEKSMEMGHATHFFMGPVKFYVPTWKKHRKLINPAFNQQILDNFMGIFNSQSKLLVTRLKVEVDKGPFDHSTYVRQNFMETICLTAIDNAVSEEDAIKYVQSFEAYLNLNISRFIKFWLHSDFIFKFSNIKKQLDENSKFLTEMSDSVLKKKRALRNNGIQKINNETVPKIKVFMDLMMDLDGEVLTDQEIKDEINTIIMAGHDTSANVTIFALLLIGSYPEVQERIYKELQEVLGDKDDVEKQDLSRLVYLEAVLKETMRYYVMAPFVGRFIDREVKLRNCTLKPGYNCLFMMYGIHRNPLWGPDVNEFKPERWLDPATMPKNPNMFVGFSTGKRNCIGKTYAMMSIKVLLSHLLRRYKLHGDHTKMVLKLDVLLKPVTGHLITLEDRLRKK
ncbi:unnamed protein product, partial [Brenthis ino]